MSNKLHLLQAVRRVEAGGECVTFGPFESLDAFLSYYEILYKPLLEKLAEEWTGAEDARRFMASDLLAIFSQ